MLFKGNVRWRWSRSLVKLPYDFLVCVSKSCILCHLIRASTLQRSVLSCSVCVLMYALSQSSSSDVTQVLPSSSSSSTQPPSDPLCLQCIICLDQCRQLQLYCVFTCHNASFLHPRLPSSVPFSKICVLLILFTFNREHCCTFGQLYRSFAQF